MNLREPVNRGASGARGLYCAAMRTDPLAYLGKELADLKEQKLYRRLRILEDEQKAHTTVDHKSVVNLSSNNYLAPTTHPNLPPPPPTATTAYALPPPPVPPT